MFDFFCSRRIAMKTREDRHRSCLWRNGQGTAEFALLAPVAMLVLFCVVQAGMMIYAYSFVSYAARLGARYAGVHGSLSSSPFTSSSVTSYVQGLSSGLNTAQLSATATSSPNNSPGSTAQVTVTYNYQPIRPFSQTTVPLSSTAKTIISY
jgi:Flp pilus assembly protein TadG